MIKVLLAWLKLKAGLSRDNWQRSRSGTLNFLKYLRKEEMFFKPTIFHNSTTYGIIIVITYSVQEYMWTRPRLGWIR